MSLNLRPLSNAEFEGEFETIHPSEPEIRVVANRNKECGYYYFGIEQCRRRIMRLRTENANHSEIQNGFLPCKRLVDAHYRCLTEDKFGYTFEEVPEVASKESKEFLNCTFKEVRPLWECRKYFDQVLRNIYRNGSSGLDDNY